MAGHYKNRYNSAEARTAECARTLLRYYKVRSPNRMQRKFALIRIAGGKCVGCGYRRNIAALDFDHDDPSKKEHTISRLLASEKPEDWERAVEESKKCKLRCANCHRERTFPEWTLSDSGMLKVAF